MTKMIPWHLLLCSMQRWTQNLKILHFWASCTNQHTMETMFLDISTCTLWKDCSEQSFAAFHAEMVTSNPCLHSIQRWFAAIHSWNLCSSISSREFLRAVPLMKCAITTCQMPWLLWKNLLHAQKNDLIKNENDQHDLLKRQNFLQHALLPSYKKIRCL